MELKDGEKQGTVVLRCMPDGVLAEPSQAGAVRLVDQAATFELSIPIRYRKRRTLEAIPTSILVPADTKGRAVGFRTHTILLSALKHPELLAEVKVGDVPTGVSVELAPISSSRLRSMVVQLDDEYVLDRDHAIHLTASNHTLSVPIRASSAISIVEIGSNSLQTGVER